LRLVRPLDHAMNAIVERLRQHTAGQKLPPPASVADIAEAEKRLGFRLPSLLRELYGMVADGSFGPPYGFLPLLTPVPETKLPNLSLPGRDSVVQLYTLFRGGDPEEPSWSWPERLLPVLEWGCAIRSCVDCSSPSLAVVRDEPYVSRITESPSLEQWLSDWMGGRDLWKIGAQ
jgi:SMI1 / KNR4 family (SUKH-1)